MRALCYRWGLHHSSQKKTRPTTRLSLKFQDPPLFTSLSAQEMLEEGEAMGEESNQFPSNPRLQLSRSLGYVHYSCGSCGYHLNLNSCNRHTPAIGSEYEKTIRRGVISFFSIDESRFKQVEEVKYRPYFTSKSSWGLFQRRTKLLCRKCGAHVGNSEKQIVPSSQIPLGKLQSISWDGMSESRMFNIRIRALQPSSSEDFIAVA